MKGEVSQVRWQGRKRVAETRRRPRWWHALLRDRKAIAAVEFALVGPPFILTMVFLTEITYDFYAQEALDYAVSGAARCIQVGAAQNVTSAAEFQTDFLCPAVGSLLPCSSITVNVVQLGAGENYQSYGAVGLPKNAQGHLAPNNNFTPGLPNTLMLVQAVYTSPSLVAGFVPGLAISTGSAFVHATMSSAAFMNENFPVSSSAPTTC